MNTHVPDRTAVKTLLDAEGLERTLSRIAHEMIERNDDLGRLALVGIHTRGVPIAERLVALIEERTGEEVELGAVDITFHRDDAVAGREQPVVHATELDFELRGMTVILVDDVLYTGRTIRAAIETLFEHGRPARVQLAVLVDRGHRELPIRPDFVGKNVPTSDHDQVRVLVNELDGEDGVVVERAAAPVREGA
jgi:pyrimidine operon attenuation protein / uracil phosphoribosyltransferase